ncbi:MAG: type II toxin-antitoxin system VapC family toxin [bacterium]
MSRILIDSGPLIALFDGSDKYHHATVEFIKNNTQTLITTLVSITETLHLLDFSRRAQIDFIGWVGAGAVEIENINPIDFIEIQSLTSKYADLPMDFADACLVFLAEKMNITHIATIDRDFDVYKLSRKRAFTTYIK